MKICKTCGKFILDDENGELAFTVNPGVPDKEYVECEICHDYAIDRNKIIQCEACGEWFSNDVLHSDEKEIGGDTFCACPSCGKDIVDGMTREERRQEEDHYIPQYSIVVQFTNGGSRGFLISAEDKRQALEKLMDKLGEGNIACMDSIHIGFVYMDDDVIG